MLCVNFSHACLAWLYIGMIQFDLIASTITLFVCFSFCFIVKIMPSAFLLAHT